MSLVPRPRHAGVQPGHRWKEGCLWNLTVVLCGGAVENGCVLSTNTFSNPQRKPLPEMSDSHLLNGACKIGKMRIRSEHSRAAQPWRGGDNSEH